MGCCKEGVGGSVINGNAVESEIGETAGIDTELAVISVGCLGKSEVYADVEITVAVCGVFETVFDSLLISGAKGFVGNTVGDCGAAFGIAYPAVDAKAVGGFGTEGYSAPVKRQNIGVGVSAGNGSVGTGGDVAVYAVTGSAYRFLT